MENPTQPKSEATPATHNPTPTPKPANDAWLLEMIQKGEQFQTEKERAATRLLSALAAYVKDTGQADAMTAELYRFAVGPLACAAWIYSPSDVMENYEAAALTYDDAADVNANIIHDDCIHDAIMDQYREHVRTHLRLTRPHTHRHA